MMPILVRALQRVGQPVCGADDADLTRICAAAVERHRVLTVAWQPRSSTNGAAATNVHADHVVAVGEHDVSLAHDALLVNKLSVDDARFLIGHRQLSSHVDLVLLRSHAGFTSSAVHAVVDSPVRPDGQHRLQSATLDGDTGAGGVLVPRALHVAAARRRMVAGMVAAFKQAWHTGAAAVPPIAPTPPLPADAPRELHHLFATSRGRGRCHPLWSRVAVPKALQDRGLPGQVSWNSATGGTCHNDVPSGVQASGGILADEMGTLLCTIACLCVP